MAACRLTALAESLCQSSSVGTLKPLCKPLRWVMGVKPCPTFFEPLLPAGASVGDIVPPE